MDRKKVYSEKLRDPRWQKRRLEIFQRDEFFCQICQDSTSTLHVHHRRYVAGREPWEYDDYDLVTLCEACHAQEQQMWPEEIALLKEALSRRGCFASHVHELACAIHAVPGVAEQFISLIEFMSWKPEALELVAKCFHDHVNPNRSDAVTPARTASE